MGSMISMLRRPEYRISTLASESGPLVGRTRDLCLDEFLKTECDYLLFIDTDMVFEPEALGQLLDADKPIVSGKMFGLHGSKEKKFVAACIKTPDGKYDSPPEDSLPETGYMEVDGVGMAFTLIKREVIEALHDHIPHQGVEDPPTFVSAGWPFEGTFEDGRMMGEDIAFCVRAKNLGFPSFIAVETRIGHVKSFII